MNLIFVKNLGFSIVCERFPIYISGEGEARPCSTLVYRNGAPPHLLGAVRPPPAPLLLCLHPHRNLCAATSVATPSRSFSGAGGYHDPLHWYRLCAVMGTRQRFPEVRTAFLVVPHDICKMSSGYTSLLEWGLKGRSPVVRSCAST